MVMEQSEKDKLLLIAKENYPVGTVFHSALSPNNTTYTIDQSFWEWLGDQHIIVNNHNGASIWYQGRWAEIVSKPIPKINNLYPIY